jgi:EmrB/QacA subfamily drug resistance transporter
MAGTFMIVLDFFIVNVALPSMQHDLHASSAALEWVVAGYGLTVSAFLITAGRLGDRIGRRRLLTIGLALFAAASLGCGLAPTAAALVVFRMIQGVGAAAISPTVLAIIGVSYEGPERARAIGVYGTTMGIAAASGQLIGGLLIQANPAGLGWRTVFLINLPVALVALIMLPRHVPESRVPEARMPRWTGMALITAGLVAVVLPLVQGRQYGWPWWSLALLAAGPLVLAGFVITQLRDARHGRPVLIAMSMFKGRSSAGGLITQVGLWCGQASFFLILALYLQQGRGLSALSAGLIFTILAGSYLVASVRSGPLTARFGRSVITAGALTLAAGQGLLFAVTASGGVHGSLAWLAPGLVLVGLGMGLCIAPLTTVLLSACEPVQAGAMSGVLSTVQQVGNSLGVAIIGIVFFGAVHRGYGHAFELGVAGLGGLLLVVAALSRLLPGRPRPARSGPEETLGRLRQVAGAPVSSVSETGGSTAAVVLPGWQVTVGDVAATALADLRRLAADGCRFVAAGRYGRFWWLRFAGLDGATAVILGSHLRLTPTPDDGPTADFYLLKSGDLVS